MFTVHSPTPATEKCNNKGPVSCRKHTQIYICAHAPTWFTAKLHRAFLAGCPGQVVQYTAGRRAVVPLIQNERGAVHLSGNQTAVTLVRSLFPQPQRGPKLPKVPDLCFHQLSFCDKWLLAEEGAAACTLPACCRGPIPLQLGLDPRVALWAQQSTHSSAPTALPGFVQTEPPGAACYIQLQTLLRFPHIDKGC